MSNGQNMKELLRPLGVYRLEQSFLGAELESIGALLDQVEQELDAVQREMTLVTAEGAGLEKIGQLLSRKPVTEDTQRMREGLAALLRVGDDGFTLRAINDTLSGCGLTVAVSEAELPGRVEVRFPEVPGIPDGIKEMQRIIEDILPAHVGILYRYWYQIWEQLNARGLTWQQMEEQSVAWKQLETMVH